MGVVALFIFICQFYSRSSFENKVDPCGEGTVYRSSFVDIYAVALRTNTREYYQTMFALLCRTRHITACICLNCRTDCWECGILLCGGKGANVINEQVSHIY